MMRSIKNICYIAFMLSSCKSASYFNSPNDLFRKKGIVYTPGGREIKGELTIQFESGHDVGKFINVTNGTSEEKIPIDSIRSYMLGTDMYYPKIIDLEFNGVEKFLFMKRLTKTNSRISLYELFQSKRQADDGADHSLYFISLPTQTRLEAWNIGGKNLVPKFDEKMSKLVEDCPTLANKIKQKSKGYFLAQITLSNEKKVEVFERIINEYNECR